MKLCLSDLLAGLVPAGLIAFNSQIVAATDLKTAVVEKGVQYVQADAGVPVADSNNGVIFEADVKANDTNLITSASIRLPDGASSDLPSNGSDEFKLKKKYNKQTGVDAAFPSGSYALTINAVHDGSKIITLPLTGDTYPNTPHCTVFAATQAINAGSYFLFSWDPMAGGGPDDFIQLHIEDPTGNKVYETPDLGEINDLDGRAVSALVPPSSLPPGQSLVAYIYFKRAVGRDVTTYPGALGFSDYYKRTKLDILTTTSAAVSEVKIYSVSKTRRSEQLDAGAPTLQATKTYTLDVFVEAAKSGVVSSSSVTLPAGIPEALGLQSDNKTFDYSDFNVNQSTFDTMYPNGNYAFKINTSAGPVKTAALNLPASSYPAAPHITSVMSALNPARDFTVSWDPFAQGGSLDFVQLHIDDDQGNKVFETPDYGKSGALLGTAVSAVVPANTLVAGRTYTARVIFQKNAVLDTTSYPGALGVVSFASRTTFKLAIAGGSAASLNLSARASGGSFFLLLQGTPGTSVRLDRSADLRTWSPLSTNTLPATGPLQISDPQPQPAGSGFYRATTLP